MKRSLALLTFVFLAACGGSGGGGESTPAPAPSNNGDGGDSTSLAELNFENVLKNAIVPACFNCHKAPANANGKNFETYENVFTHRAAIEDSVKNRRMPDKKGRTMTDAQRSLLLRWLAAGAPRNAPVSFTSLQEMTIGEIE